MTEYIHPWEKVGLVPHKLIDQFMTDNQTKQLKKRLKKVLTEPNPIHIRRGKTTDGKTFIKFIEIKSGRWFSMADKRYTQYQLQHIKDNFDAYYTAIVEDV